MQATAIPANWFVSWLYQSQAVARGQSSTRLAEPAAIPPARGRWILHGFECLMVRRRDERLGCYIRVPHTHELYARTDLSELSFALDCAHGITYADVGAHGFFIGTVIRGSWEDAWDLLDDLAQQLLTFTAAELPSASLNRVSGVHSTLGPSDAEDVSEETA
jgi:hypothetical protein